MPTGKLLSRLLAATLVVALSVPFQFVHASGGPAMLTGTVLTAGSGAPLNGAKVHLGDPRTGKIFSSAATAEDGGFQIEALPPATYEVVIEFDGSAFVVTTPIVLSPDRRHTIHLVVNPGAADNAPALGDGRAEISDIWDNSFTAAVLVLFAAGIVGWLIEDATNQPLVPDNSKSTRD